MAFRPIFSVPKPVALAVGSASFLVLYAGSVWLLPRISPSVGLPIFICIFILSGSVAGYIAKRSPLMHGALVGLLSGLLAITYVAIVDGVGFAGFGSFVKAVAPVVTYMAIPGIVLCSLGAAFGDYLQARTRGL